MRAVRFHQYGEPTVLRYEDTDRPVPNAGEVLLRVAATTFNPVDGNIRAGFMQGPIPVALPHTLGSDVAGTVDTLGDGVDRVAVGDRVIAALPLTSEGASAEFVIVPAELLAPAPASIDLADAAALPLTGLTAWQALFDHAGLKEGQRVLINGAGGVVGSYAVQLAKHAGAHVIATTGPRSAGQAHAAGADEVLGHGIPELAEPVDVVLNLAPVTPEQLAATTTVVRDGGVVVNTTVWMPAPTDEARGVRGINLFVRPDAGQLAQLAALVDAGTLRIDVARRIPLQALPALHAEVATSGPVAGKTIVTL